MIDDEDLQASLIVATIDVIAENGYAAASLESVAQRAGVQAAAVDSDFPTLVAVAMGWMYGELGIYVGTRIDAADDGLGKVQAYIRAMNGYFFDNPSHIRVMGEVIGAGELSGVPGERPRQRRWQALADLLDDGKRNGLLGSFDSRAVAIVIGGAIDGLIVEWTADPSFDLLSATEELVAMVDGLTRGAAFAR